MACFALPPYALLQASHLFIDKFVETAVCTTESESSAADIAPVAASTVIIATPSVVAAEISATAAASLVPPLAA